MGTQLSSAQIGSFMALARELNFSRAAESLHITQPALTRRIQNLEAALGQVLFLRLHGGLELTESGRILQRHAASVERQEQELLDNLQGSAGRISGFFRVVSFSSCLGSVLVPAIGPLLRENPLLSCQFSSAQVHALHDLVIEGKADFSVSLSECQRIGIENVRLGTERYVLIESSRHATREDCYIDHEPRDNFTERFFVVQTGATVPKMLRAYFDDIHGLIDAVAEGIGRAVVPSHLLRPGHPVRLVPGFCPWEVPVFLHYQAQPRYTRLQQAVIGTLTRGCARYHETCRSDRLGVPAPADDALLAADRHPHSRRSGPAA